MQADSGNVGQVVDQVVNKVQQAGEAVKRFTQKTSSTPPPLPQTPAAPTNANPGQQAVPGGAPKGLDAAAASYGKATIGIKQLAAGFAMAQGAILAVETALRSVSSAIGGFIDINSRMEQIQMQFKVMIGDIKKYWEIFTETKKFADTTPFNDVETYRAGQQLLAAQIKDINEYKAALATVADLAAASGRPISEAAGAYARLKSGASGEAMEALRLMNISRTMFEAKGVNFDASGQALATSEKLTKTLDAIVKDAYGGLTQQLSTKWAGLWSTFTSNAQNAVRDLTGGVFMQLETALDRVNKALESALKDPDQQLKKLGAAFAGVTGAAGQLAEAFVGLGGKGGSSALRMLTEGLAFVSLGMSTLSFLTKEARAGMQLLWDSMSGANARENFVANMKAATDAYNAQLDLVRGSLGLQKSAAAEAAQAVSDANQKAIKERSDASQNEVERTKTLVRNMKTAMAIQESAWAVEKAKGRDSVQLARMEMEQRKQNLAVLTEQEEKRKAAIEANGGPYSKSSELLEAEAKAAQSLAAYYDALIEKKEKMGAFISQTAKLLAEADAIDKRGGDSGVKRYEALKASAEEYLDSLKKMRDSQAATAGNAEKMKAAAAAAQNGNLAQYQTVADAVEQGEQIFQIKSLQERLAQIQQLSQAQNLGARERFSLYEQERAVFAELTGSIGKAIESTMQKIEALQGRALGAASSAIGVLGKVGAGRSAYNEVADMVRGLNLNMGKMSLSNLGAMANLASELKGKGVNAKDLMPSSGQILEALKRELAGVPDTIGKLQAGLNSLVGISEQLGKMAADQFFAPWEAKIAELKRQFAGLAGGKPEANPSKPEQARPDAKAENPGRPESPAVSKESYSAQANSFAQRTTGNQAAIAKIAEILSASAITWPKGWSEEDKNAWGLQQGQSKSSQPYNDPSKVPFWKAQIPAGTPPIPAPAGRDSMKTTNINAKTSINIQGYTMEQVDAIVGKAKERFGEELYQALQNANAQYGY